MNKQDTGFLQSRKLEEVQLPKALPPPNRIVPCGKRRYLRGSEFCCGPPKAPISAAALKKEGEWRQSRKGGGRMVAVKERCQSEGKYKGRFETQSSRFSYIYIYISEAQSTP